MIIKLKYISSSGLEDPLKAVMSKRGKMQSFMPLIAGAGSMTSIISLRAEFAQLNIMIAIIINMFLVFLVLKYLGILEKFLGEGGIAILRKVFGIILLAIAVKLFASNVKHLI